MKNKISLLAALLVLWSAFYANGQDIPSFSLQQSIDFALKNRASLQTTRNEQRIADAQVGEIRAMALPQISGVVEVGNNFVQQKTLIDPSGFGGPPRVLDPFVITPEQLASGQPVTLTPVYSTPEPQPGSSSLQAITFVQPFTGSATVTGSQVLFDGTVLIGLKAANTFTELSRKSTTRSEIEVAEQVSKAYYGVLVNRERFELLNQNLTRLDTLLYQTGVMFENGVAEKLDVDRLRVQLNNLKVEKQNAERLMAISENLLKFQMGVDQKQPILLSDELAEVEVDVSKVRPQDFDYSNRIEYSLLETQRDLAKFELQGVKAGYLPKLYLNGRYGYSGVGSSFSDVMDVRAGSSNTNRNYFDFGYVGAQLQVPVFDGLRKHYQMQQAKIALENTELGFQTLTQSIDLELEQASVELTNALDVLASRRENMALAEEIARVAKIKFQEGVGTNLEVVNAETDLREAQTNYYAAMYDALVAKVNLDRATGTLLTK